MLRGAEGVREITAGTAGSGEEVGALIFETFDAKIA